MCSVKQWISLLWNGPNYNLPGALFIHVTRCVNLFLLGGDEMVPGIPAHESFLPMPMYSNNTLLPNMEKFDLKGQNKFMTKVKTDTLWDHDENWYMLRD